MGDVIQFPGASQTQKNPQAVRERALMMAIDWLIGQDQQFGFEDVIFTASWFTGYIERGETPPIPPEETEDTT